MTGQVLTLAKNGLMWPEFQGYLEYFRYIKFTSVIFKCSVFAHCVPRSAFPTALAVFQHNLLGVGLFPVDSRIRSIYRGFVFMNMFPSIDDDSTWKGHDVLMQDAVETGSSRHAMLFHFHESGGYAFSLDVAR